MLDCWATMESFVTVLFTVRSTPVKCQMQMR